MLVETLAGDFDPSEFEDDYAEAVETLVKTKIEGGEVKRTPTSTKSSGEVVDLLAALQRSVDAARTARGETPTAERVADDKASEGPSDEAAEESAPAKKTATSKTAKKSTAKKAPAKKSTAKKSTTKKAAARKAS
jgi:DNA end-binding protein Ku